MISFVCEVGIDLHKDAPPRTEGVHLSEILRDLAMHTGYLKADKEDLDDLIADIHPEAVGSHGTLMRCVIGYCWEDYVFKHIPNAIHQPGEFSLDGIIGTPDGEGVWDGQLVIHESKATFKSANTPVADVPLWMWQLAGYLQMLGEEAGEEVTRGVMHPLYIKGDYKGIDPKYIPQVVEFEWLEVQDTWDMVRRHRDKMQKEGRL